MPPLLTYTLLGALGVVFVAAVLFDGKSSRKRWPWLRYVAPAVQVLAVVVAYMVLRPGRGDDARARIVDSTAHHAPILLDMYSNY